MYYKSEKMSINRNLYNIKLIDILFIGVNKELYNKKRRIYNKELFCLYKYFLIEK